VQIYDIPVVFPYATLFRSFRVIQRRDREERLDNHVLADGSLELVVDEVAGVEILIVLDVLVDDRTRDLARLLHREALEDAREIRSEEHTSELQSRENIVCR